MVKREFMKELKGQLLWQMSGKELREILREYENYFATAAAGGKDEATAAAELGEPKLVATEILSERHLDVVSSKRSTFGYLFAVAALGFTVYTYVITPFLGNSRYFFENVGAGYLNSIQLLLLTPTVLAFLVFPRIKPESPIAINRLVTSNLIACTVGTVGYTIIQQSAFSLLKKPAELAVHPIWSFIGTENIGQLFAATLCALSLMASGFIFVALVKIARGGIMIIPLLYLNCTCIMLFYCYAAMLHRLSDPSLYEVQLYQIVPQAILGLTITAASFIVLRQLIKRGLHQ